MIGPVWPADLAVVIIFLPEISGSAFIWQRSHAFLDCLFQSRDLLFVQKIAGQLANLQSSLTFSFCETLS
jgi:hypothetical protein